MINKILKWTNLIAAILAVFVFYFDDGYDRNWFGISAIISFMLFKHFDNKHNNQRQSEG